MAKIIALAYKACMMGLVVSFRPTQSQQCAW